jgi:hypothetical protein
MNLQDLQVDGIYTFVVIGGIEMIAKVVTVNNDNIIVADPVTVMPSQGGVGLMPSLFTGKMHSNYRLNNNSISIIGETDESVKAKYIEATTGLKVPDKKVILG